MKYLHSVATTFVSLFIFVSINFTGAAKASTVTYDLTVIPIVGISSGTGVLSVNGPVGPGLTSFGPNDPNIVTLTFTFGSTTFDLKNDVGASYGPITFFDGQLSSIKASDFLLPPAVSSTAVLLISNGGDVTYVGPTSQDFSAGIIIAELRATPIPGALPLFAAGLGVFGLLGLCRKRKSAAAIVA